MKTKLLKLALCAMAALPIGAWADSEVWSINYASLATGNVTYSSQIAVNKNTNDKNKINGTDTYPFSCGTVVTEGDLLISRSDGMLRYSDVRNLGLFNNNKNFYGIRNLKAGDVITIAYNGGGNSNGTMKDIPSITDTYNVSDPQETGKNFTHTFTYNEGERSLDFKEYDMTVSTDGNILFALQTAYIGKITVTRPSYSLTINAENGTVTKSPNEDTYESGTEVTLTATPNDGYKFVSWSGVDSSEGTTATVTMNADKNVTATFEKKVATTVWKFDQYVASAAIFKEAGVGASAGQYIDGLYFHSRDKKSDNHGIIAKLAKVINADLNTHFGTYKKNNDYMGALIGTGGGTAPDESTEAGTSTSVDGVSYKAPAAGKFYATVVRSANTSVIVYKNGEVATQVTFSDETPARELEVEVAAGDNIYLISPLSNGKQFYLWNAGFVPSTDDAVTKTVNITEAGYATFSATQNYQWSTSTYPELKAYTVSAVDAAKATITEIAASEGYVTIPACTGVILKGDAGPYTFTSTKTAGEVGTNSLIANLADYILPANDGKNYNYTLAPGPKFMHVASTEPGILASGKAFLRTTVNAGGGLARGLDLVFDEGETTGISAALMNNERMNNEVYNLAGQRVAQPTRGLYIVNGKKVIIK